MAMIPRTIDLEDLDPRKLIMTRDKNLESFTFGGKVLKPLSH